MNENCHSIKRAVFELIARHQDFTQLQIESSCISSSTEPEKQLSEYSLVWSLRDQASARGVRVCVLAPSIIAKRINELVAGHAQCLLTAQQRVMYLNVQVYKVAFTNYLPFSFLF